MLEIDDNRAAGGQPADTAPAGCDPCRDLLVEWLTCIRMLEIDDIHAEELLESLGVSLTTLLAR